MNYNDKVYCKESYSNEVVSFKVGIFYDMSNMVLGMGKHKYYCVGSSNYWFRGDDYHRLFTKDMSILRSKKLGRIINE